MKKRTSCVVIGLLLAVLAKTTWAYPPDNAAVLYYWAFSLLGHPSEADRRNAVVDYAKGKIPLNEDIEQILKSQKWAISLMGDASSVDHCDWGLDYSKGIQTRFPELHKARFAAGLLAADAKQLMQEGDTREALRRLLTIHRMARHIANEVPVFYVLGVSMSELSNQILADALSDKALGEETFVWLKTEMARAGPQRGGLQSSVGKEARSMVHSFTVENWPQFLKDCAVDSEDAHDLRRALKKVGPVDDALLRDTRQYYVELMTEIQAAMEKPFDQAYPILQRLEKKPGEDIDQEPDAIAAFMLKEAVYARCLCIDTRCQTRLNAVRVAIDLHLTRIRTGRLPDALPPGLPQDLFSGRDFSYEKTEEGFVLRCHAPDPSKETIHEYSFKVN